MKKQINKQHKVETTKKKRVVVRIYQSVASAAGLPLRTRHFINTLQNQPNSNKEATQTLLYGGSADNWENQRMWGTFHSVRSPEQVRDRGVRIFLLHP